MKKRILLLLLTLVLLTLTACGSKGESGSSDGKNAEIKGKIVIYTSMYEDIIDNVKEKLKQEFPNLEVEFFQGGTGTLQSKIVAEMQANKLGADMLMVAEPSYSLELKEKGVLHAYVSKNAENLALDYDKEGYWYPVRILNMVLAYNPDKFKKEDLAQSFDDNTAEISSRDEKTKEEISDKISNLNDTLNALKEEYQEDLSTTPVKLELHNNSPNPKFHRSEREEKLKHDKAKMKVFLNSTLKVSKNGLNKSFNSITKESESNFVKAVIDENSKGYLGSRIRFRLLEDIYVGKHKINKGTMIYGQISGFSMQRVNLNVISILNNGEILPINLSVYDVDGMKGLYVPESAFRDMMRELGQNSVQGTSLDNANQGFFTSFLSKAFSSASQTIANLIRKNKAKLKYNSYIYLINEKEFEKYEDN